MASENILEVSGVVKRFGRVTAVREVSLELPRHGSLGIVGESGSGKTTLANMIIGRLRPSSGTITVLGRDRSAPARSAAERRRRAREVQMVFQDPYSSLDPRYTAEQVIAEVLGIHRAELDRSARRDRVIELCDLVGLDTRQRTSRPGALSGGQMQRIAIARALAANPEVVILDEAVAALDVSIQAQILNLLTDIRVEFGTTFILISHDLAVVRHLTEDVVVMQSGQVIERGRTAEVLRDPQHPYTRQLRDSVPRPGWVPTHRADIPEPTSSIQVM
ncbi:ABC transporter ATP-binding protein [Leucobacter sp. wl10]|uniref:ABC transporter ATP-binding protein n=1 Tax=Leucobacter sp. wl10 TaxID=2304677 RepID=UPI000E5A824B|nr:ATP-binding cassette domain-containing protein [Leucobacter sp. wl10]RGE17641.1 ABC transporter ATP-binding protein [Leucobacter sp. wl10]